jgi:geranylgeranyl diphosphate synthase type II
MRMYRRAKTGALFEAAAAAGAIAAGGDGKAWRAFGQRVGEAYQIADDIHDVTGTAADLGKPVGRDAALGRPNAATHMGLHGSTRLLERLMSEAAEAIPPCHRPEVVVTWLRSLSEKLTPSARPPRAHPHDLNTDVA